MRHKAIYELYPECIGITDGVGAFDPNNKLIEIDENLVANKILELRNAEPMRLLREERNRKLAETDWKDLPSYPGTDQEEWRTYRQSLRDLPSTASPELDENGQLSNVTWPTKPE